MIKKTIIRGYKISLGTDIRNVGQLKRQISRIIFLLILSSLVVAVLAGCGKRPNYRLAIKPDATEDSYVAKVYFLRPAPLKYKGVADNPIYVRINGSYLLEIAEGEYHLARLKPAVADIGTLSLTMFTNHTKPQKVTRSRTFDLVGGKTYFILLKRVDEEFRGIYYIPEQIDLQRARTLASQLRPRRDARSERIEDIQEVPETPPPAPVTPTLPEELYPGEKYIIKPTPQYKAPEIPEGKNEISIDQEPEEKIERKFE